MSAKLIWIPMLASYGIDKSLYLFKQHIQNSKLTPCLGLGGNLEDWHAIVIRLIRRFSFQTEMWSFVVVPLKIVQD